MGKRSREGECRSQRQHSRKKKILRTIKWGERSSEKCENSTNGGKKGGIEHNDDIEEEEEVQRHWMKRVELPNFEGNDPMGWISRAEIF